MATRAGIIHRVQSLRRVEVDDGASENERLMAKKMADKLVALHRLTAQELSTGKPRREEDYSAFGSAFSKAGFKPSRRAEGSL